MLEKSRISKVSMLDENGMFSYEWRKERTSKFTSSQIYKLCDEKGFGDTGMNYIRTRVFEDISKVSTDKDILTQATADGIIYEIPALQKFMQATGNVLIVTQKIVKGTNPRYSSTPDGLIIRRETNDDLYYDASTVETKCFQPERHMKCVECTTPQELKAVDRKTYFQVLDQLLVCDCLNGFAVYYHPDLPINEGGMRIIEFRKMQKEIIKGKEVHPIKDDMDFLHGRKEEALKEFERIKSKILKTN